MIKVFLNRQQNNKNLTCGKKETKPEKKNLI